jgi:hypothetical protein
MKKKPDKALLSNFSKKILGFNTALIKIISNTILCLSGEYQIL